MNLMLLSSADLIPDLYAYIENKNHLILENIFFSN